MRKNKVHRFFCISFKVNIKWPSVNNRWPIAVRKPTVHGAVHSCSLITYMFAKVRMPVKAE